MKQFISLAMSVTAAAIAAAVLAGPPAQAAPASEPHAARPNARTITVYSTADTYLAQAVEEPLGDRTLRVGYFNKAEMDILIRFDLPAQMGTGATITNVELQLFCMDSEFDTIDKADIRISVITKTWDENKIIFRDKPPAAGPIANWELAKCSNQWVSTKPDALATEKLIDAVQKWYDQDLRNFGWLMESNDDRSEKRYQFQSKEGTPPGALGLAPRILITFEAGTTPTPTASQTPTPSDTPTPTDTLTPTNTATPSDTPTPTNTPTLTPTPTSTNTPTYTPEATDTPTPARAYLPILLKEFDIMPPEPTTEPAPLAATGRSNRLRVAWPPAAALRRTQD